MQGFYKVAFEAGLSVEEAADMHAQAIIDEACERSPEFAQGLDKTAAAAPWWNPGSWFSRPSTPARQPGGFWNWLTYGNSGRSQSRLDAQIDAYARRRAGQVQQTTAPQQPTYKAPADFRLTSKDTPEVRRAKLDAEKKYYAPGGAGYQPPTSKTAPAAGGALGTMIDSGSTTGKKDFRLRPPTRGTAAARG